MNVNLHFPKVKKPKINKTNLLLFVCLGSGSSTSSVCPVSLKRKKEGNVNLSFPKVKTENNETNLLLFIRLGSSSTASSVRPVFLKKKKEGNFNLRSPKVKKPKITKRTYFC